jgi:hypothetical protein
MFDRQDVSSEYPNGACAVTILNFSISNNQIEVKTYDVNAGDFLNNSNEQFPLSIPSEFRVSTSGNLFTVNKGGSVIIPVSVNLVSGTAKQVSLSVAWIPTGSNQWFTTSFSPTTGYPPLTSTLTITASDVTQNGTYTAEILASASGNAKYTLITIAVNPYTLWNPSRDFYTVFENWGGVGSPGGYCYGMSSTAILYFEHYILNNPGVPFFPSQSPEAQQTSDLWPPVSKDILGHFHYEGNTALNNVTLAIMVHQIYDSQNGATPPLTLSPQSLDEANEFSLLVYSLEGGEPVLLGLGNSSDWVHAVVAWDANELPDGTYNISISDPNFPNAASLVSFAQYNPTDKSFAYSGYTKFCVIFPGIMVKSWIMSPNDLSTLLKNGWLDLSVTGYYIIMADRSVTISSSGLEDYFAASGDSRTFVCGIPGSSGIEEGGMQVYAIPEGISFSVADPAQNESSMLITRVDNESGQLVGYGYLLNATATQGPLNYTVSPTDSSLSIIAGNSPLSASVTFFAATEQDYSVSQVSGITVNAMQMTNFTVANWETLNDTGIQTTTAPVPEIPSFLIPSLFMMATLLTLVLHKKRKHFIPRRERS